MVRRVHPAILSSRPPLLTPNSFLPVPMSLHSSTEFGQHTVDLTMFSAVLTFHCSLCSLPTSLTIYPSSFSDKSSISVGQLLSKVGSSSRLSPTCCSRDPDNSHGAIIQILLFCDWPLQARVCSWALIHILDCLLAPFPDCNHSPSQVELGMFLPDQLVSLSCPVRQMETTDFLSSRLDILVQLLASSLWVPTSTSYPSLQSPWSSTSINVGDKGGCPCHMVASLLVSSSSLLPSNLASEHHHVIFLEA